MDTRTNTASPPPQVDATSNHQQSPSLQDKISAYYSLVFPHFTFYVQTLSITIGRRCVPNSNAATSSTAAPFQVDVDLGALKNVSRLHAKIEYDADEDRFVLVVIGRNGAWVDGVWSASSSRVPLAEKSVIQIASRTFEFVLPPPPPPEDTPSPSSNSSLNRQRSPSVDITSFSPPSSQPSHSPPPRIKVKLPPPSPEPQIPVKKEPELPNSNLIGKANGNKPASAGATTSSTTNSKKRKKGVAPDPDPVPAPPRPKPEDMPPKPPYTYAQLIYRAINATDGKATLQEICNWIQTTFDYYRWADSSWMSSVRHNLSSGRAFVKMERCGGDRGKGFFWSLDEKFRQAFEDQEAKLQQAITAANQGSSGKDGGAKASRRKDKGAPLPPPLTSTPLTFKPLAPTTAAPATHQATFAAAGQSTILGPSTSTSVNGTTGVFSYQSQVVANAANYSGTPSSVPNPYVALTQQSWRAAISTNAVAVANASASTKAETSDQHQPANYSAMMSTPATGAAPVGSATAQSPGQPLGSIPTLQNQASVPDVSIPIIIGPIPASHPDYSPLHPPNFGAKEGYMVLHERTLILDPNVFSTLTKEMLVQLEKMGARAALGVLTGHMVRALKEKRAKERGMRRAAKMKAGSPAGARTGTSPTAGKQGQQHQLGSPFTRVPLSNRAPSQAPPASAASSSATVEAAPSTQPTESSDALADPSPSETTPTPLASATMPVPAETDETVIIVGDNPTTTATTPATGNENGNESDDLAKQAPAPKRRKVDAGDVVMGAGASMSVDVSGTATPVQMIQQGVDEDEEIDVV